MDTIIGLIVFLVIAGVIGLLVYFIYKKIRGALGSKRLDALYAGGTEFYFDQNLLQQVRQGDPEFSSDKFFELSKGVAEKLQNAWSKGDMTDARNYVSQGVYNRFRIQLELILEDEKKRNILADFMIRQMSVLSISESHSYQTLHVKMTAKSKDVTVDADQPWEKTKAALDAAAPEEWTEIYSFTRKKGVQTDRNKNYLSGQCPNCGYVPDNFSQNNKCASCGSIYNSGDFDWVLSEITQIEEWTPESGNEVPGLDELETLNLSINRQIIEDRASYLFWRWIYVRSKGSKESITRDCTPAFLSSLAAQRETLAEIAVGSVDLEEVWRDGDDVFARTLILWSALFNKTDGLHQEHALILKMPVSLKNPYGLADHSCNTCGGPLPETDALKCQYCGSDLPVVVSDWLLDSIEVIDAGDSYDEEEDED